MLQVIDDFLWTLRREGFAISPAQAIDVMRVAREVGFVDAATLRDAIGCVVVDAPRAAPRYRALFASFFAAGAASPRALDERLRARGFSDDEIRALRELLEGFLATEGGGVLRAMLVGDTWLDHRFTSDAVTRWLGRVASPAHVGFYAHRVFDELGLVHARAALTLVRDGLIDALGSARGAALAAALAYEVDGIEQRARDTVAQRAAHVEEAEKAPTDARSKPFATLSPAETEHVRRAVRALAAKLAGAARARRRHARHGRIDAARTMRQVFRTGGVPFQPVRVDRRRDRPRLVLLCDVSDSVRPAARFLLEFVYAMRELFERTRCFVFVSDVTEVTWLLVRAPIDAALTQANILGASSISSYGRALAHFERRYGDALDRRTTLLVLGDGRTNHLPDGAAALGRLRERAKDVVWLTPEPRSRWGQGDSAMARYAAQVSQVIEAASADGLERAARELVRRAR